jgi:hypothetical protein
MPPTLLIGANVVKVVPCVRNVGFVLNERIYCILRSLRPHAAYAPFEVRRHVCVTYI